MKRMTRLLGAMTGGLVAITATAIPNGIESRPDAGPLPGASWVAAGRIWARFLATVAIDRAQMVVWQGSRPDFVRLIRRLVPRPSAVRLPPGA